MKLMDYKNILNIIEKYNSANQIYIKNNIFDLMKDNKFKRQDLAKELNISKNQFDNLICSAKTTIVSLEMVMKICIIFNVGIEDLIQKNVKEEKEPRKDKRWTEELKTEFLNDYQSINEDFTLDNMKDKYNLIEKSIRTLYKRFEKERT